MKNVIMLMLMLIAGSIYAQEKQNIYYFKKNGKQVQEKDSADYIRTIRAISADEKLFSFEEVYKSGRPKKSGKTSSATDLKYEGIVTFYNEDGIKEEEESYSNGKFVGEQKEFYETGQVKLVKVFDKPTETAKAHIDTNFRVLEVNDASGKKFLDDKCNGKVDLKTTNYHEEGSYVNGYKNGVWKEQDLKNNTFFEEVYENGKFISGTRKYRDGKIINYKEKFKLPEFRGGGKKFGEYLSRQIVYPSSARANKIEGRVVLNFVVEKDGSLSEIRVWRSPNDELANEALRVLANSPKWAPGEDRGEAVRVSFSLPIMFKL
jgi:TonB family protein